MSEETTQPVNEVPPPEPTPPPPPAGAHEPEPPRASLGHLLYYAFGDDEVGDDGVTSLAGHVRPAIVVADHGTCYNVQIFMDAQNDGCSDGRTFQRFSRCLASSPKPGFLHWPTA